MNCFHLVVALSLTFSTLSSVACTVVAGAPSSHADLVVLFEEWRDFQKPRLTSEGIPDYSAEAMAAQYAKLGQFQSRLEAMDASGWSIADRVDRELVRAEMNGLEFDQRVRQPWARDPAFYVMIFNEQSDTPAHEGPVIDNFIDLWTYSFPLSQTDADELAQRVAAIPPMLQQARLNLVGDARDLWVAGIRSLQGQSTDLQALADRVRGRSARLDAALLAAKEATDAFVAWLGRLTPTKRGPSGVGKENYTWYLQRVHLLPYTWEEAVALVTRELARAHSSLRLEENRNRRLPALERVSTPEEYDRLFNEAVTEYMRFLKEEEILPLRDFMDHALRERIGSFMPARGLRSFFSEVSYRGPIVMRTHDTHWIDLARMREEPHPSPIRRGPLLYNIWDARAEGLATGMEEMMMRAGFLKDKPQARELIWILLAQRAARALGGLHQHSNDWTMEEAAAFTSKWTPRGWLPSDSELMLFEQQLYLRQPGYGASYVLGKIQIEELMAERSVDLGDEFNLGRFMEDLMSKSVIPVSMIRWEMTGRDERVPMFGLPK